MKNVLRAEHEQMRCLHPRDAKRVRKNKNRDFFDRFMELKEKVKKYMDCADPFIKLLFKTGQIHLPSFQECGDMANAVKVSDRMITRAPSARGFAPQPQPQFAPQRFISQRVPITRSMSQISVVSQKRYADRSGDSKWSCEEDSKMPFYKGKGTFVKLSGCKDDQTSADGFVNMENGAMTGCIITYLRNNPGKITIGDFLFNIRKMLQQHRFEQIPQIGSNNVIDSNAELAI